MKLIAALLLFTSTALGQLSESITVEVVDVPVYVTAGDGTPMRGLKKDAFSLFVNGKPKAIDYFEEIDLSGAPVGAHSVRPPVLHQRRLYLLLFDLAFSRPGLIEGVGFLPSNAPRSRLLQVRRAGDYLFLHSRYR